MSHDTLMLHVKKLGYNFNNPGICYGLAHMGMQAVLAGDLDKFDNRLKMLLSLEPDELEKKINSVRQKIVQKKLFTEEQKKKNLSPDELLILEMPAFLDGVILYFQPYKHPEFFEEGQAPEYQDAMRTASVIMPKAIIDKSGIDKLATFTGMYSLSDLEKYFESLAKSMPKSSQQPFSLVLINNEHAIQIGFDGTSWVFIDANNMPSIYFPMNNFKAIAKAVHEGFSAQHGESVCLITNTYTSQDNRAAFQKAFKEWQNNEQYKSIHKVTVEKALILDSINSTWLNNIIENNAKNWIDDKETLKIAKEILALNYDTNLTSDMLNYRDQYGRSALMTAVPYRKNELVKLLVSNNLVDANIAYEEGETLLNYAIEFCDNEVIQVLLKSKYIDINQPNNKYRKAIDAAYERGDPALIDQLKRIELVNRLFDRAVRDRNIEEIKRIKLHKDFKPNTTFYGSKFLDTAVRYGHFDVVRELLNEENTSAMLRGINSETLHIIANELSKSEPDSTPAKQNRSLAPLEEEETVTLPPIRSQHVKSAPTKPEQNKQASKLPPLTMEIKEETISLPPIIERSQQVKKEDATVQRKKPVLSRPQSDNVKTSSLTENHLLSFEREFAKIKIQKSEGFMTKNAHEKIQSFLKASKKQTDVKKNMEELNLLVTNLNMSNLKNTELKKCISSFKHAYQKTRMRPRKGIN